MSSAFSSGNAARRRFNSITWSTAPVTVPLPLASNSCTGE